MDVNESHIILSIDPGTNKTGYALLSTQGPQTTPLDFGVIRPKNGLLSQKHLIIFESIEALIQKQRPHCLAVESQYVHKNPRGALTLGQVRGLVLLAAARASIPVYQYAPSKIKLACTGSGRASKEQVGQMVKTRLNLPPQTQIPEDAADALAIGLCHIHSRSHAEPL